jgi:hypothetical protein
MRAYNAGISVQLTMSKRQMAVKDGEAQEESIMIEPHYVRNSSSPECDSVERLRACDWREVAENLDQRGYAIVDTILSPEQCESIAGLYEAEEQFRSRVDMASHGFGRGEYKYFDRPLPGLVASMRESLYARLARIANRWNEAMEIEVRYPDEHADFLDRCHRAGQTKPTPLLLRYEEGDYNCLHQDLYGEHVFPLQVAFLLSAAQRDFTGGEFILSEQRPRMQSRVEVVPLRQGDGVIFAVNQRPVQGTRGVYRVNLRHGVSRLRSGHRMTLGIIFHDAQ